MLPLLVLVLLSLVIMFPLLEVLQKFFLLDAISALLLQTGAGKGILRVSRNQLTVRRDCFSTIVSSLLPFVDVSLPVTLLVLADNFVHLRIK